MTNTNLKVILSHHHEDLNYLRELNSKKINYHVYSTTLPHSPESLDIKNLVYLKHNKGNEGYKYACFIRDNYESIKSESEDALFLFLHAHFTSVHQTQNILEIIKSEDKVRKIMKDNSLIYYNITREDWYNIFLEEDSLLEDTPATNKKGFSLVKEHFETFFRDEINPLPVPKNLLFKPCAQFFVTKQAILNRSLSFWNNLIESVENTEIENYWHSRILEYCWHYIFTLNEEEPLV